MKSTTSTLVLAIVLLVMPARQGNTEVLDAGASGFGVRYQVKVSADRMQVWQKTINGVGSWWSDDHTISGNAANMYIDARVQGCFCETLGDTAGVVHLIVTFVNPGVMLRLTGGLGPLGLMGVAGNMTWEFEDTDAGTLITLNYMVGGYHPGGLDTLAAAVDSVLSEQMQRLKSYVETGEPAS